MGAEGSFCVTLSPAVATHRRLPLPRPAAFAYGCVWLTWGLRVRGRDLEGLFALKANTLLGLARREIGKGGGGILDGLPLETLGKGGEMFARHEAPRTHACHSLPAPY